MQQYSIVLSPPEPVLEQVKQWKRSLRAAIGCWYKSVNALAHITFNEFKAGEERLAVWKAYLAAFTAMQHTLYLRFGSTGSFANGAFYLAPDAASESVLIAMMKDFHARAPERASVTITTPHMTIGRGLDAGQLAIAKTLIPAADIRFTCEDLVLRRFNPDRKQYDIYKRFSFGLNR
ncbi:2'-5' RNA ligase [Taibaiella chishuiensis]|uniref:2'-5' RNA ligase n=2 Tax=Taibaiella chishuiensis TaxID=1434707 RepID=A0A2P8CXX0_9BACT|nr:2'-5' RNA ligase [Taibaiella chishuiensis]